MTSASMNSAPLYGLVLAGGRSVRMGEDKGGIVWHDKPQRYYMADVLTEFCETVYISCRPEQENDIISPYKALVDSVDAGGPIAGILSAFAMFPHAAWMVVACDLPLLTTEVLKDLLQKRNPLLHATAFRSPSDGMPEPLIAIWEPSSYLPLRAHLSSGGKCPRKFLINNSATVFVFDNQTPQSLLNANTQEDKKIVNLLLGK